MPKNHFLPVILIAIAIAAPTYAQTPASGESSPSIQTSSDSANARPLRFYIGTYTSGESEGIYLADFDLATGQLANLQVAGKFVSGEIKNPSFLAIHPQGHRLYSVSEVEAYGDSKGGAVAAFTIDPNDGELTLLNHQSSAGAGPCYVSLDREGKTVFVANYGGGTTAYFATGEDGALLPAAGSFQHTGSSVNKQRQSEPHAHSMNADPQNRFVFAADLGIDKLLCFRFDAATGKLERHQTGDVKLPPGSGPRHFAFHPNGKIVYVINELANTVAAFSYAAEQGAMQHLQTIPTLPEDFTGQNTTAEIQIHPTGKFLYGSNRGHDSIAMFVIDPASGKLTPLGQHPAGGKTPRNFTIDPTGAYLLSAHQDSNTIVAHSINQTTGQLTATDNKLEVPTPVCIKFAPTPAP
jgi:6-phosphogluconolactonase